MVKAFQAILAKSDLSEYHEKIKLLQAQLPGDKATLTFLVFSMVAPVFFRASKTTTDEGRMSYAVKGVPCIGILQPMLHTRPIDAIVM